MTFRSIVVRAATATFANTGLQPWIPTVKNSHAGALGEERFADLWAQGRAMDRDAMVRRVLDDLA